MDGVLALLPKALLSGALEHALCRYLTGTPKSRGILVEMTGKVIAINAPPLIRTIYLVATPTGIQLQTEFLGLPDVTLTGTPLALAKLGARGVRRADLFAGEIEISGDVTVAEQLQRLFQASEVPWQRLVGGLIPPMLTDPLSDWTQSARTWGRETALGLQQDLGEFLREETRDVPSNSETQHFLSAVDQLRDDCERLEARIDRLQNLAAGGRPGPD